MKKVLYFSFLTLLLLLFPRTTFAVEDPLSVPNNKFGIHILFQDELKDAAKLVNSNGGDWGYILIPIQSGDRDLVRWQKFMDATKQNHVIPIIRLASEGDYFNTKVWRRPDAYDVLDFANFLNSLDWPTKNRYVVVFNEPNRGDEWGGTPDPADYAEILSYAVSAFKAVNEDFFIISAGFDNASITIPGKYYQEFAFLQEMNNAVPGIFEKIDGIGSHSYPNPGFSKPPTKTDSQSIATFRYENDFIKQLTGRTLPVFITETGWTNEKVNDQTIGDYFKQAFETIWTDEHIVAITPFLFKAGAPPFDQFSFVTLDGGFSKKYNAFAELAKQKGQPTLYTKVLGEETKTVSLELTKRFEEKKQTRKLKGVGKTFETLVSWVFKI